MSAQFAAAQRAYENRTDTAYEDGEAFADWLDANPDYRHDYMAELKSGVMDAGIEGMFGDELTRQVNLLGLAHAVANDNQSGAWALLRLIVANTVLKTEEYDEIAAREAFEREWTKRD